MTIALLRAIALLGLFSTARLLSADALTGLVTAKDGTPVAGARVFVYTAAPKVGPGALCPSCYPDCGKSARADAAGRFAIAELSPQLVFRLLVVAPGHAPKFVPDIEATSPAPQITLERRTLTDAPAGQTVRGRVVNAQGVPVFGAVLDVSGVSFADGRIRFGGLDGADPLAVSDENGDFLLQSPYPMAEFLGRISARGLANQAFILASGQTHTLTLTEGATLTGRMTRQRQPLAGIVVGLCPQDLDSRNYVGKFEVGTDADGRFTLPNLPPSIDYYVYGTMTSLRPANTLQPRPVHLSRDGSRTDLGDLEVAPSIRLRGRVVLPDGGTLPPNTALAVGRGGILDLQSVELTPTGEFEITGLGPGVVTLSLRLRGYRISPKNRSYDASNRRLMGRIEGDQSGLEILLEQAESQPTVVYPIKRTGPHPQELPLHGVELSR